MVFCGLWHLSFIFFDVFSLEIVPKNGDFLPSEIFGYNYSNKCHISTITIVHLYTKILLDKKVFAAGLFLG